jgi:hypothetical protein
MPCRYCQRMTGDDAAQSFGDLGWTCGRCGGWDTGSAEYCGTCGADGRASPREIPRPNPGLVSQLRSVRPTRKVLAIVMAAGLAVWGGYSWLTRDLSPSCSWPVRVRGDGSADEAGVVRCYLRDLAHRDVAGLTAIANDPGIGPKMKITAADLRYSADAGAGLATVYLAPDPIDSSVVGMTITYANGVKENVDLFNMDAFGGASTWRMGIGS